MAKPTRYTQEMEVRYLMLGYWDRTTLSDLWIRNAKEYPDREAVVDSRKRLTWAQAKQWIDRVALSLLELGFKKDNILVVQLPNCVELCLIRIACERAGIICMPLLRTLRHTEIEEAVNFASGLGIIIPWRFRNFDYIQMIEEIKSTLPSLKHVIVAGDEVPEGFISLEKIASTPIENKYSTDYLETTRCQFNEFSMVLHTTGTTGFPKFVEFPIPGRVLSGKERARRLHMTNEDVVAVLGPAAAGPNVLAHLAAPHVAAKIVMLEHFEPESALKLIEKERASIVCVVPTILEMVIRQPDLEKYDLSSIRYIISTGASLPFQLGLEVENKIKCTIVQEYGSVDSNGFCMHLPEDPQNIRLLTVGKPVCGAEIKFVDDEGREVPAGEVGEIMGRGPAMDVAYFKNVELTWKSWTKDGWFRMGDLGRLDEQGNVIIAGRKKDVIIRGGQNIYPPEIENMLLAHPKVHSVALVGIPDSLMGEKACACIIPREGTTVTLPDIVEYLKTRKISPYKLPEKLALFKKFPLVGDQKVDKKELVRQVVAIQQS